MIESLKDQSIPEEFKEMMRSQGVPNEKLVKLIEVNPRVLFDVFDENEIFIEILYMETRFHYTVSNKEDVILSNPVDFDTRKECEVAAVKDAFDILEEKLNKTE